MQNCQALLLAGFTGLLGCHGIALAQTPAARDLLADPTPGHAFTGQGALYTEYEYRGISQTSEKPAGS
jgi:hypothetical protein